MIVRAAIHPTEISAILQQFAVNCSDVNFFFAGYLWILTLPRLRYGRTLHCLLCHGFVNDAAGTEESTKNTTSSDAYYPLQF